jgi:type II secretory ATPase GspE/PulE/Tfp pilus assembly ATPase PilB-like protein
MAQGVGGDTPLGTSETGIVRLWKNDEKDDDNGALNGYIGRVGIYEVLANTESIQSLIVANATNTKIQEQAINEGMITMQADGLIKALRGETTIDELLRVTKE